MGETATELQNINNTLKEIRDVIKAPETLLDKVLEYGGSAVSILGIMSIIDIIRNWILGG